MRDLDMELNERSKSSLMFIKIVHFLSSCEKIDSVICQKKKNFIKEIHFMNKFQPEKVFC